jgi:hypothetical protein
VRKVEQVAAHQRPHLDHRAGTAAVGDLIAAAQQIAGALRGANQYDVR